MNSETMTGRKYNFNPPILDDIKNSIDWAEEKGLIKGREEGKQEGLIEGEKRGLIKVAKRQLLKDTEIEVIREIIGLSIEEINKLVIACRAKKSDKKWVNTPRIFSLRHFRKGQHSPDLFA